jgi:hypothetical protein
LGIFVSRLHLSESEVTGTTNPREGIMIIAPGFKPGVKWYQTKVSPERATENQKARYFSCPVFISCAPSGLIANESFFPGIKIPGYIPKPFSRAIVVDKTQSIRETKYNSQCLTPTLTHYRY